MPLRLAALLVVLAATADAAGDPHVLLTHAADVLVVPPGGLVRLELPPEVLAVCRPDLSDVRLFDPEGREVPYLVDSGRAAGEPAHERDRIDAELLDVRREEVRRPTGPPLYREVYRLTAPPADASREAWELVVQTNRREFVRQLRVEQALPDGRHGILVEDASLFRLQSPAREKIRLGLAALVPGAQLVVSLEGEDDAYLAPSFRFERARAVEARVRITVPLREVSRTRAGDRTVIELARPAGLVPDVLRVDTTTTAFDRRVGVWDVASTGRAVQIGGGALRRLEPGAPHEQRQVELSPARGERLRVEIVDRDSPPLEGLTIVGEIRQPALFFSLPAAEDGPAAATLYFGGGRVPAPHYDLAGLASVLDSRIDRAELRNVRPNPTASETPALEYAMRPAADLDTRLWSHRRSFVVQGSPGGLSRLRLTPEDLARARPDLADVRVVDESGRQWPYLVERDAAEEWVDLAVAGPQRDDRRSRYTLALPVKPLHVDRLDLETAAPFLDRSFRVLATRGGEEDDLAQGRLVRRTGRDARLSIGLPLARVDGLALVVWDGDDAPLTFRAARAHVPLPELYLAAPPGAYALLVGNPDARAPVYELARLREAMLAVTAVPAVSSDAPAPNPDYSARARAASDAGLRRLVPQVALWVVLVGAVLALTVVTLRLARREE